MTRKLSKSDREFWEKYGISPDAPNAPRGWTLAQIADAHHAAIEAMSAEERAAYVAECQQFRREQALLAMPLANTWIN
jgi:hypothetical protein